MQSCTRRGSFIAVLAALSVTVQGCTLVGAGVGAGIDALTPGPYEERAPAEFVRIERNERVIVRLRNGADVTGRYFGVRAPSAGDLDSYLLVDKGERLVDVKMSDVSSIAVEVSGKGWLYGGLVGLAVDTAIVVAVAVAVQNMKIRPFDDPSGCFC
jgi:hypothetical protein